MLIDQLISEHEADFDAPVRKGKEVFEWRRIAEDCEALAKESNDLRVALWWLRARAQIGGLEAWADGLAYILELLELPEASVYPLGDEDFSGGDIHATVLNWLACPRSVACFRLLPLTADGAWKVGFLLPDPATGVHAPESEQNKFREAIHLAPDHTSLNLALLNRAKACVEEIAIRLDERAPGNGCDFSDLISALGHAAQRLESMSPLFRECVEDGVAEEFVRPDSGPGLRMLEGGEGVPEGLVLRSRDDVRVVLAALERYYRDFESGHPATIFIQRLQRMVDMSFESLMQELFSESERLLDRLKKPAVN